MSGGNLGGVEARIAENAVQAQLAPGGPCDEPGVQLDDIFGGDLVDKDPIHLVRFGRMPKPSKRKTP